MTKYLPIATLTLVAALLRIPWLGRPLMGDEGGTFNKYGLLYWKTILSGYEDTNQHTLFSLLSNFCLRYFGENEIYFRLPSFMAGVVAVPLLYYLSRSLNNSGAISFLASTLLAFSAPHLSYSQEGRGYALTVFLAITLILATTKLLQKKNPPVWGALLVVSGLSMVLTIPSNMFFLVVAGAYCIVAKWLEEKHRPFDKHFLFIAIVFGVLLILVGVYLGNIYTQLRDFADSWGKSGASKPNLSLLLHIAAYLALPWGSWLYAFFILGWFGSKSKNAIALFTCVFAIPVFLMFVTGIGGFARTYIYLLPFVMILTAVGIEKTFDHVQTFNPLLGKCLLFVVVAGALFESGSHLNQYYSSCSRITNTPMSEARQVYSFVQTKIPMDQLIVITRPGEDVLNHYLQRRIHDSAMLFFHGKKPDRIIFVSRYDTPPWTYPASGASNALTVPQDAVRQIAAIGDTRIYEFGHNIERLIPADFDPDYATKLFETYDSQPLQIEKTANADTFGKQSLVMRNNTGKVMYVNSNLVKSVDIEKEGTYILLAYLREWTQDSDVLLVDYNKRTAPQVEASYLLPFNKNYQMPADGSCFIVDKNNRIWEMMFALYPIKPGHHDLVETFSLVHQTSYFDGIQSFIVTTR